MATNISAEQRRIQRQIDRLLRQREELGKKKRIPVIKKILQDMKDFNIDLDEIAQALKKSGGASSRGTGKTKAAKVAAKRATKKVPPKYRNPETGETWSGRGRTPIWLVEAEQNGLPRDDFFLIEDQAQGCSDQPTEATDPSDSDQTNQSNG